MGLSYDDLFLPFHESMKPREAWRIGAEAEKFGVDATTGAPIPYEGPHGVLAVLEALADRYGWTRGEPEKPGGPLIALLRDGASVTLEPGGQLELSGAPLDNIHQICAEMSGHLREVAEITQAMNLAWLGVGFHPFAREEDLPWVPKLRYAIMRRYLPTRGSMALDMMRRSATVQANFDYSSEEDAMRKLRVSLKLSPLISGMVANSPFVEGRMTGERSRRTKVWLNVDPDRQGLLPKMWSESAKIRDYVEWALDVPMFLVKRGTDYIENTKQTFRAFMKDGCAGHQASSKDWEIHLNTMFPEVRLKRIIEVRGADSLPYKLACSLPALWTGILYDDTALAEAEALCRDWTFAEVEASRPDIAARALQATFRGEPLAAPAAALLDIARGGLARRKRLSKAGKDETVHLARLGELVDKGMCPADDLVRGLSNDDAGLTPEMITRTLV